MNWRVDLDFKRGPSFCPTVIADTEAAAIEQAKRIARECGFTDPVKKAKARPE